MAVEKWSRPMSPRPRKVSDDQLFAATHAMMSRVGMFLAVVLMVWFCYRLIIREESALLTTQGERYRRYLSAVPRMWPALAPRLPSAGHLPQWTEAFKSEFWCWGFALSVAAFTISLSVPAFFIILGSSVFVLWLSASVIKPGNSQAAGSESQSPHRYS